MVLLLTQGRGRLHYSMSVMDIHDWTGLFSVWFGTQNYNSLRLSFSIQGISNSIYLAEALQGLPKWSQAPCVKTPCKSEGSMQGIVRQVFAFILLSNSPLWKWTKGEAEQKLPFGDVMGEMRSLSVWDHTEDEPSRLLKCAFRPWLGNDALCEEGLFLWHFSSISLDSHLYRERLT